MASRDSSRASSDMQSPLNVEGEVSLSNLEIFRVSIVVACAIVDEAKDVVLIQCRCILVALILGFCHAGSKAREMKKLSERWTSG